MLRCYQILRNINSYVNMNIKYINNFNRKISPISQSVPVMPVAQVQVYVNMPVCVHVPPFWQGAKLRHMLVSVAKIRKRLCQ